MISINRNMIRKLFGDELADAVAAQQGLGLVTSNLFSFGSKIDGVKSVELLRAEPEPRRLLLVGMSDRYDAGAHVLSDKSGLAEICVSDHSFVAPTPDEARRIAGELDACAHPAAPRLARAFRDLTGA